MERTNAMERTNILETLRQHESELKAAGILHLRLFGSVARGEQSPTSDIDLLADFDETRQISLLRLCHLQNQIADLLGVDVDLVSSKGLRTFARQNAEREAVLAF